MTRLYRRTPDSSELTEPRVFTRVLCDPGTLVDAVRFYRTLTAGALDMDMDIPEQGLHVVAFGPFLVLEIDRSKLDRSAAALTTHITVLVAHLDATVRLETAAGAVIDQERFEAPPGSGTRLRHPDGGLVEYLEHRPSQHDVATPGTAIGALWGTVE